MPGINGSARMLTMLLYLLLQSNVPLLQPGVIVNVSPGVIGNGIFSNSPNVVPSHVDTSIANPKFCPLVHVMTPSLNQLAGAAMVGVLLPIISNGLAGDRLASGTSVRKSLVLSTARSECTAHG